MPGPPDPLVPSSRLGVAAAVVDGRLEPGDVEVRDGRIAAVGCSPSGRGVALPGLVDLQVNGFAGVDLRTASVDEVHAASRALAAQGCTAFRPTLCSTSIQVYTAALERLDEARSLGTGGARLLGAHLEGPFLSPTWRGAHDPATLCEPDVALLDRLLDAGEVGMMTLAPELPGADALVERLVARGVVVSIGHTDADAATTRDAVARGARHLTHCWNAHRRFAPRDPGPAGVALGDPRVTVGLLADLVHVAPEVVLLTLAAARGRVAVTTDALPAAGLDPSTAGGAGTTSDGRLAGGLRGPLVVLRGLHQLGVGWPELAEVCSGAATRTLGGAGRGLRPGDAADVVVLDDDLGLIRTLVGGVEVAAG